VAHGQHLRVADALLGIANALKRRAAKRVAARGEATGAAVGVFGTVERLAHMEPAATNCRVELIAASFSG
jgi:hypothetical protein